MFEFGIVMIAVTVVMATRWHTCGKPVLGVGGALSAAIGMRVFALFVSGYLSTIPSLSLYADDSNGDQKPIAEAKSEPSDASVFVMEDGEAKQTEPVKAEAELDDGPLKKEPVTTAVIRSTAPTRPAVPIVTNVRYLSDKRPSWLEAAPKIDGEHYVVAVRAGPYPTLRDCLPDLEREIQLSTAEFINDHLNAPHASTLVRYSLKDLRQRNVVREQFSEQLETSLGLMSQVHAMLVFDDSFRDEIDHRWSEIKSKSRLAQTGLGAGIVILFLATLFSFLKIDTATKGYYTGRLQMGAAATILALVAASVLLAKWIPWM